WHMVTVTDFRHIFGYNWQVLRDYSEALGKLPTSELQKNREATHNSLKNIFHHLLSVHDGWLNVTAQGASADPAVRESDVNEFASIAGRQAYIATIIATEGQWPAH